MRKRATEKTNENTTLFFNAATKSQSNRIESNRFAFGGLFRAVAAAAATVRCQCSHFGSTKIMHRIINLCHSSRLTPLTCSQISIVESDVFLLHHQKVNGIKATNWFISFQWTLKWKWNWNRTFHAWISSIFFFLGSQQSIAFHRWTVILFGNILQNSSKLSGLYSIVMLFAYTVLTFPNVQCD